MSSQRQLEANRMNAKRSSGPKTPSGKARSSMNAREHGLTGKSIVLGDEDPKEFDAFRAALEEDFRPGTTMERELVDRLAGLLWRLRRVPAIEATIVKSRQQHAYDEVYSTVEKEKWDRIDGEARWRCGELLGHGSISVQMAIVNGTYDAKFAELRKQVLEERRQRDGDLDSLISEEADERYENSRESELVLLIRAAENGDLIDRLSRYEAGLMNAMNKTLQQLWLVRSMTDRSQTITPETAAGRARLASNKLDFGEFIKQGERLGHDSASTDKWVSRRVEGVSALPLENVRQDKVPYGHQRTLQRALHC